MVRRAIATDVAFIMSTERMPGYDALVASWTSQQHALALADSTVEYLIIEAPVGEPAVLARQRRQGGVVHGRAHRMADRPAEDGEGRPRACPGFEVGEGQDRFRVHSAHRRRRTPR